MQHLISALASVGIEVKRSGAQYRALCPFHNEKTRSFTVYPDGHYKCYGCGAHGFVDKLTKQSIKSDFVREPEKDWPEIDWTPYRKAMTPDHCARLAAWRGYSLDFVKWMRSRNIVGIYDNQFCFPITHDGKVKRLHVRHVEYREVKQPWSYFPKEGCKVGAMIVHVSSNGTHICESQWDSFAVMEQLRSGTFVATRGAWNTSKLSGLRLRAPITAWPQNDEAGGMWLRGVLAYYPDAKVARVPSKDVNDFVKQGGKLKELI